ncbi:MAG TPA: hypothetical protein VHK91_15155 [Flavisolibacter sp.]|nr:hypothetical protein [Flavisolibacter sp.]
MRLHKQNADSNYLWYGLLAVVPLLMYWPLSTGLFSLKNDAVIYFLPYRFHVSESIQHGYFPFWSPYLFTGVPLHADIQSGVWNPVVFLFSLFSRYSMRLLQWETLFYICLAGWGFFKLCRSFSWERPLCFLLAVAYQCSGFFIDSCTFIPWIASAAYVPFVLVYFKRLLEHPSFRHAVLLAFVTSLLFLAGYLSFFIITFYLLLFITIHQSFLRYRKSGYAAVAPLLKGITISAVISLLICLPAIVSYLEFLPYYARGKGASLQQALSNPFHLKNTFSWLFPSASYRSSLVNDISARNAYFGLVPLFFMIFLFVCGAWKRHSWLLLITLLFFLFSLGAATPVRTFFYHVLPLMNSFRHPATARLFTIIGGLLLSGFGYQAFQVAPRYFNRNWYIVLVLLMATTIYAACQGYSLSQLVHYAKSFKLSIPYLKQLIDTASMEVWILILAPVQFIFLLALWFSKGRLNRLVLIGSLNMAVMAFFCMPFTTVSTYRTALQDQFIRSGPTGFPIKEAQANVENNSLDEDLVTPFGYRPFYSKKISVQGYFVSPTTNSQYGSLLHHTEEISAISSHPFYYADLDSVKLTGFEPQRFTLHTDGRFPDTLHLTQQFNHNWEALLDGRKQKIELDHRAFMKIVLPSGNHTVEFRYRPLKIIILGIISFLVFIACIIYLAHYRQKK